MLLSEKEPANTRVVSKNQGMQNEPGLCCAVDRVFMSGITQLCIFLRCGFLGKHNVLTENALAIFPSLSGKGLHLAMTGEPRGFSRVASGFSSYDGEFRMPLVLAQGSPIFHSSCEGKLGIALE